MVLNKKKAKIIISPKAEIISPNYSEPRSLRMKNTPQLTLSQVIEGYFRSNASRRLSEHTLADYANTYRLFCEYLSDDFTFAEITRSPEHRSGPSWLHNRFPRKRSTYHIGLSALWTWALREGYAPEHVVQQTPRPRPEEPEITPYTQDDFERLVAAVEHSRVDKRLGKVACSNEQPFAQRHRAILLLLLDTGIRVSELSTLKIHQVELRNRRINVCVKGYLNN